MKARQEFKRLAPTLEPGALLQLATLFVELQELRHQADYEPGESRLTRVGVLAYQKLVDAVVEAFEFVSAEEWREIATIILFKERR